MLAVFYFFLNNRSSPNLNLKGYHIQLGLAISSRSLWFYFSYHQFIHDFYTLINLKMNYNLNFWKHSWINLLLPLTWKQQKHTQFILFWICLDLLMMLYNILFLLCFKIIRNIYILVFHIFFVIFLFLKYIFIYLYLYLYLF